MRGIIQQTLHFSSNIKILRTGLGNVLGNPQKRSLLDGVWGRVTSGAVDSSTGDSSAGDVGGR